MPKKRAPSRKSPPTLRERAEAAMRFTHTEIAGMSAEEIQRTVHELQVHQIELEMQNEELRRAQTELSQSHDRFNDLYDSAPVGYLTLDAEGTVIEANLTVATMLGVERGRLVGRKFTRCVARGGQDAFYFHQNAVREAGTKQTCELVLRGPEGTTFPARLESIGLVDSASGTRHCRCAIMDITEQKFAEEALARSYAELEQRVIERTAELAQANAAMRASERREHERAEEVTAILDVMPAPVFIAYDPDCQTITGNRAAEELLRLPRGAEASLTAPEEARPRHFRVFKDGRELLGEELPAQRAARGEVVQDFEETVVFDDGTSRDMTAYATPLRDDAGRLRGSILILIDLTARKQAEKALRESEALLRAITDHSEDMIFVKDRESRLLFLNPAGLRLNGLTLGQVLGHTDVELHRDSTQAAGFIEMDRRVLESRETTTFEEEFLAVDGTRHILLTSKTPRLDDEGNVVGIVGISRDITERKAMETSLRESETKYRQLVHALPAAVYTCDVKGRITLYNAAAVTLWGRAPEPGRHRWDGAYRLYTAEGKRLPREKTPIAMAIRQDEPIRESEMIVERPDGSRSEVLAFADPTHDSSGAVVGAIKVLVDITALKTAENSLRTSNRALRKLSRVVEQSPTSVIITDPAGAIDYVNPKFTEVTGYSADEVLGKNPRLLKSGVQPVGLYRDMWETIKAGREWRSELCNRKKNGELFWEYAVIAPIEDEHGNVTHFVAIKEDITERKQTEKALAESRHRLAGIVGSAMDAIISVDAGQRIVLFNAAAEKMFRCPASEAIGGLIDRFIPKRFHAAHKGHIRRFGETGVTSRAMGRMGAISGLRADGEEFPIEGSISQVEVRGEKISTVILRDITERIRLEHDVLEISAHEQRRIGQDLHDDVCQWLAGTEFLASALAKDLARRSPAEAPRALKIVESIRQANARARMLAHGLAPAMLESAGLAAALRELAANTREMFPSRCHYEGPEAVPVRDSITALHLYRIAQEAISNAVRHGGAREIHIILQLAEDSVSMLIRDDGNGISRPQPETRGMGLRTMRYRAGIIGATLEIRRGASGGTEIACTLPKA